MHITASLAVSCLSVLAAAANLPSHPIIPSTPRKVHASSEHVHSNLASKYLIANLPNIPASVTDGLIGRMYSGTLPIFKDGASLFFWYIESSTPTKDLIIWLNENGPLRVSNSSTGPESSRNPYSWDNAANVLYGGVIGEDDEERFTAMQYGSRNFVYSCATSSPFFLPVEQPVGTGFAFGNTSDYVTSEIGVGEDFYLFLNNFYHIFPETVSHRLFISGESYAGEHLEPGAVLQRHAIYNVLSITSFSLTRQDGRPIPLAGILVGDGA
ncbi:serine carboxypeptidase-domain-containing protein [Blyttiomyces helicus]|uniref:Carboxypeptidase n=1 Tax=Blyttiomyces helicus TaxID=388810 RepID=A0A4P9VWW8_9FUNG|nr:serine carboxypeptidase-domain-containing protein [Blyttiomyces helicus]|eukprot:RKO83702.1 serine carboxypeptidase-domain-containing protein [Blyttiomyces helicus]